MRSALAGSATGGIMQTPATQAAMLRTFAQVNLTSTKASHTELALGPTENRPGGNLLPQSSSYISDPDAAHTLMIHTEYSYCACEFSNLDGRTDGTQALCGS